MGTLKLKEVAGWMNVPFTGEDKIISGVSTDSRRLGENELFFALTGERSDGHHFMNEAEKCHAAAVVVSQKVKTVLPVLQVQDTCLALGQLATHYRQQFISPMAAITGSYGKTTVKEMLAGILEVEGPVLATKGNLNTEVGVPLTLLRLTDEHRMAVIEMGARKKGDIQYLMQIAKPTVALVTNAGIAHIEVFGSEREVLEAKGEMYANLTSEGIAVLNTDDPNLSYWQSLLKGQQIFTYGMGHHNDVSLTLLQQTPESSEFKLSFKGNSVSLTLHAPGVHNVRNALAAAALALAMGASLSSVQTGLQKFQPVSGRLQFKTAACHAKIIDDTYNANPVSMRAALAVLAAQPGTKLFVMGDMLELGQYGETWHRDIGEEAKRLGIDKMYGLGELTQYAIEGFGNGAMHYPDKATLIKDVTQSVNQNMTVLVKGSRGMRMEEVVLALLNQDRVKGDEAC